MAVPSHVRSHVFTANFAAPTHVTVAESNRPWGPSVHGDSPAGPTLTACHTPFARTMFTCATRRDGDNALARVRSPSLPLCRPTYCSRRSAIAP